MGTAVQYMLTFFRNVVGARIARPLSEFMQDFGFVHLLFPSLQFNIWWYNVPIIYHIWGGLCHVQGHYNRLRMSAGRNQLLHRAGAAALRPLAARD